MANGAVADDGFAFDDLSDDGNVVVGKQHANAFADRSGVTADRDKLSVGTHADRNVTSETQHALCA
jgi:hypothetical protein